MARTKSVIDLGTGEQRVVPYTAEEEAAADVAYEAEKAALSASPESVTARQFKMQLVIAGLKQQVDAWVSLQSEVVQVAYEYSGNFLKNEPMMQTGFSEIGFTERQRDAFFIAASKL